MQSTTLKTSSRTFMYLAQHFRRLGTLQMLAISSTAHLWRTLATTQFHGDSRDLPAGTWLLLLSISLTDGVELARPFNRC
mmetsp:Transcript_7436/g.10345  ORF Transcript_7436/g.10345 Transcript_7436/m.10345 type:complete len:80 (-) Transcript_7436:97-336(-)